MNENLKHELLLVLSRTPSGDNCQPWSFVSIENKIEIRMLPHIAVHTMNCNGYAEYLSLGMMLEGAQIWAQNREQTIVESLNLDATGSEPWATISWQASDKKIKADILIQSIFERATFRGFFNRKRGLSPDQKTEIEQTGVKILNDFPKNCWNEIFELDKMFWNSREIVKDITHWIHLTRTQYQLDRSGFHWTEVAYGAADFFPIALLKKWPALGRWIYKLVGTIVFQGNLKRSIQTSSGFVMIDCPSTSKTDLVNTGRKTYRCLLKLNEWGYYAQPMTLYSIYSWMQGKWPINPPFNENLKTLKLLHEKYIEAFGIKNPFWLFRFGVYSKKLTPSLRKQT